MKLFMRLVILFSAVLFWASSPLIPAPVYPENGEGTPVCLFESGTRYIHYKIAIGDTLVAWRILRDRSYEVGTIVVLSFVGDYYIQGRILGGKIQEKDIVRKADCVCVVISTEGHCFDW